MNHCIAVNHHITTKEGEFSLKMGEKYTFQRGKATEFHQIFWPKETLKQEVSTLNHTISLTLLYGSFAPIHLVIGGSRFSVHEPRKLW